MIFIPYNVPSSKNNKVWTGRYLVWSKNCQKYKKLTEPYWNEKLSDWNNMVKDLEYPLLVSFKFIRNTRHKFDYINPLQTVLDLMVEYGWIPDDNSDIVLPFFEEYEYDKNNPGVIIKIVNSFKLDY